MRISFANLQYEFLNFFLASVWPKLFPWPFELLNSGIFDSVKLFNLATS